MAKLLLATADPKTREVFDTVRHVFARWHSVLVVDDGKAAIEHLACERIDVLVSDILLPGRDGFELVAECDKRNLQAKVILLGVMSSQAGTLVRGVCAEKLGRLDALIIKPYPEQSDPRSFQETLIATIAIQLSKNGVDAMLG